MTGCSHDHEHAHLHEVSGQGGLSAGNRLLAALVVIVVFMVVEVIGGLISGSLALLADAAHMMTDATALGLAASAHWMAKKPPTEALHFGYRRIQVLAAFVNGIALAALMAWIIYESVRRSIAPIDVAWKPMLAISVLGLLANAIAFRLLHRQSAADINVRGAMLHVMSDLMGSVAAVVAALVIATTGETRIDPLLSILVAILIGRSAYKLLKETSHILLEGAPAGIDAARMADELKNASPDIEDIHNVQVWQLTPEHPRVTLHARLKDGVASQEALSLLKQRLQERFGIANSTIQIETGACCDGADDRAHEPGHEHVNGGATEFSRSTARGRPAADGAIGAAHVHGALK